MIDPIAFVLAVFAVLATPGPTNTLLATSGAAAGFKRSLPLLIAEIAGYMISISVLSFVVGPLVRGSHELSVALRIGCGLYLLYVAVKLWREGAAAFTSNEPVKFRRVFIATLLNPKAIVFAFVIVPHLADGRLREALPYMGALSCLIVCIGGSWIGLGALLQASAGPRLNAGLVRRAGAVVLGVFATLISTSVFTS